MQRGQHVDKCAGLGNSQSRGPAHCLVFRLGVIAEVNIRAVPLPGGPMLPWSRSTGLLPPPPESDAPQAVLGERAPGYGLPNPHGSQAPTVNPGWLTELPPTSWPNPSDRV